jgi:hypothetical protein
MQPGVDGVARTIAFEIGDATFTATLFPTPVADALWDALPIETGFSTWGDEIYFDTGVTLAPDATQETVQLGDVGYWPPGRALCLFYGPIPMSAPGEIRPASPVAVFGKLDGDPKELISVTGRRIRVRRS